MQVASTLERLPREPLADGVVRSSDLAADPNSEPPSTHPVRSARQGQRSALHFESTAMHILQLAHTEQRRDLVLAPAEERRASLVAVLLVHDGVPHLAVRVADAREGVVVDHRGEPGRQERQAGR